MSEVYHLSGRELGRMSSFTVLARVRHAYMLDGNIVAGGPDPWKFGDHAIAAIAKLHAAKVLREEIKRAELEEKNKKQMEEMMKRVRSAT